MKKTRTVLWLNVHYIREMFSNLRFSICDYQEKADVVKCVSCRNRSSSLESFKNPISQTGINEAILKTMNNELNLLNEQ